MLGAEAYQSPQFGKLFDEVLLRGGSETDVIGHRDGSNANRSHFFRQELRSNEVVVAATDLQEGDGKAVDVYLHVVRLASQNLRRGVDLYGDCVSTACKKEEIIRR